MFESLSRKTFSNVDQTQFAKFSGDHNPIHVDPIAARRTLVGQCVVHGMHGLLWALESLIINRNVFVNKVKVDFLKPIFLNEEIDCEWDEVKSQIRLSAGGLPLVKIKVRLGLATALSYRSELAESGHTTCVERNFSDCLAITSVPVRGCTNLALASMMFPICSRYYGDATVCDIGSASYIVGMECPGLHSFFVSFEAEFKQQSGPSYFSVVDADARFCLIRIAMQGQAIQASIEAFQRPAPTVSPTMSAVVQRVNAGSFEGVRALIIGGSRGIGEVIAKMVCAGGGDSVITYNVGRTEAESVVTEIGQWGGSCEAAQLNILRPDDVDIDFSSFNQIYFFATPKIAPQRDERFNLKKIAEYRSVFVDAFKLLCNQVINQSVCLKIFYPSTIFIDDRVVGFEDYVLSKIEGEKVCDEINALDLGVRIIYSRLPRLNTDQNQSVATAVSSENVVDVMLPIMKRMANP